MVMEVVHEDMGEGSMQCTNHPYKNSTPQGGICAFCLQEKLGKLVSSSFPLPVFPSSSSSSSPSFRSDFSTGAAVSGGAAASSLQVRHHLTSSRLPFAIPTHKKKKKKDVGVNVGARAAAMGGGGGGGADSAAVVFKRSKSTATPRRGTRLYDENSFDLSPHRRGFWSFLYNNPKRIDKHHTSRDSNFTPSTVSSTVGSSSIRSRAAATAAVAVEKKREEFIVVDENESPDEAAFDRKVSRSRSVGCGSRSFSGDFFERISTGFGDCTLRRVESQREGKPKIGTNGQDCIKERVKCGGIFSGFMITSSSSSSSSSSYLDNNNNSNNNAANSSLRHHNLSHGRSKSWGWALASPMRAFTKNSATGKRDAAKNAAPNLAAIPSLLAVSG
ncbi:hypothetical protein ABFS82_07G012900 [Erythranthe guttata]